jgi:beta-glucosidase
MSTPIVRTRSAATAPADRLPAGFTWGAATAAYQIEGAPHADGRGPSIWDTFSHTPGRVAGGDTGDVACEHYHRYPTDVALLRELGIGAYRFSLSWPRIHPDGGPRVEQRGLDFYRRLVDTLLDAGIEPWLTLYHWDLPQPLEDAGGWPVRDTAYRFADLAATVHAALGDRVTKWITLNEPWCSAFLGYASGVHAPGRREPAVTLAATHHLLLGHGLALEAVRDNDSRAEVGITLNTFDVHPASQSPADMDAARRIDGLHNRLFLDPVLLGRYPADVLDDLSSLGDQGFIRAQDLRVIGAPIDHLGVNYYHALYVAGDSPAAGQVDGRDGRDGRDRRDLRGRSTPYPNADRVRFVSTGRPVTAVGWEVDGAGITRALSRIHRDYPEVPMVVTENGAAYDDRVSPDGTVHDPERLAYLEQHIGAVADAVEAGVPVTGYFVWSLLDNFEWAEGFAKRFGIVYVDFATQQRIVKSSGLWYAGLAGGPVSS